MHDFQEQYQGQVHGQRSQNMACRFTSSSQQEIEKLLEDKDSENTKRSTTVSTKLFYEYIEEENIQEPHDNKELAQVLKSFYAEARKKYGRFYPMGSLKKLRFGLNRHFKVVRGVDKMN